MPRQSISESSTPKTIEAVLAEIRRREQQAGDFGKRCQLTDADRQQRIGPADGSRSWDEQQRRTRGL